MCSSKGDTHESSQKRTHEAAFKNTIEFKPRWSKRVKIARSFGPNFITYIIKNESQTAFNEIMSNSKTSFCEQAINNDIEPTLDNNTWQMIDLPLRTKLIDPNESFNKKKKKS